MAELQDAVLAGSEVFDVFELLAVSAEERGSRGAADDTVEDGPQIPVALPPLLCDETLPTYENGVVVQTVLLEDVQRLKDRRFNSTNHHGWAPYRSCGHAITVDPDWWYSLGDGQRYIIEQAVIVKVAQEPVLVPHEAETSCMDIYHAYMSGFEFGCWRHLRPDAVLVPLSHTDRLALECLSLRFVLGGSEPQATDFDDVSAALVSDLELAIRQVGGRSFAKTAEKSAKNDVVLQPHETAASILTELTRSQDVLQQSLGRGATGRRRTAQYLVVQPWDDRINRCNEFRVIISARRVVGITQQCWAVYAEHTAETATAVVGPILHLWRKCLLPSCPYADCVLDVYVTNGSAHLIEINPCGLWSSSGSGLFHWVEDRDILSGNGPLPVRVVVERPDACTLELGTF